LDSLMNVALKYRDRIDLNVMLPRINWREPSNERRSQGNREDISAAAAPLQVVTRSASKNGGNGRSATAQKNELEKAELKTKRS
jgi:hypothetical protein